MDTATITLSGASTDVGKLNTNAFAGSFTLGSTWTTARLGVRVAFDADPGTSITACKFFFGFGSGIGANQLYGAVSPVAQSLVGLDVNSLTFGRGAANVINAPSAGFTHARIVNGTRTGGTAASGTTTTFAAQASPAGSVLIFELNKAASTYVLQSVCRDTGNTTAPTAITTAQLKTAMQQPLMTDVDTYLSTLDAGYARVQDATGIVNGATYQATNGYFNAVHVAWNKSSPLLIVDDILLTIVTP